MPLLHAMTALITLSGCDGTIDAADARRWVGRHESTLAGIEAKTSALLARLPSLPGDRFFCRETIAPPGMSEEAAAALEESLCRQQRSAWLAERYEAEETLGTTLLNGAFQQYGVAGAALSLAGPEGVEWASYRGLWGVESPGSVPLTDPGAVALEGEHPARVGWGRVSLADPEGPAVPEAQQPFAIEWQTELSRREATATVRLVLLSEGTPDAAFVRRVLGAPAEPPVTIPVQIP